MQGDIAKSGETGQRATADTQSGIDTAISFQERAGCAGGVKASSSSTTEQEHSAHSTINQCCGINGDIAETLDASYYKGCGERQGKERQVVCYGISAYESNAMKSSNPNSGVYEADTSRTLDNNGGNPACNQGGMIVLEGNGSRESHKGNGYKESDVMYTLNTIEQHAVCVDWGAGKSSCSVSVDVSPTLATTHGGEPVVFDARGNGSGDLAPTITGDHQDRVTDYTALCIGNGQMCNMSMRPIANSLDTMHDQQAVMSWSLDRAAYNQGKNAKYNFSIEQEEIGAQVAKGPGAVATQSIVRRLTPLECERLQGYPDHWTDIGEWTDSKGKKHKDADSPRYKALGNSIAVPCWRFILQGISERVTERTMASLFSGIGGFELIWEELNGSKSCRWVSEIEEFPIAVTKRRFEQE